jgi:endonuclease/exonuclease/phosphatase family metal-dependent hydrolase
MAKSPAKKAAPKNAAPAKKKAVPAKKALPPRVGRASSDAPVAEGDRISVLFEDMLTPEQRGSDRFLDIVTWNIKWFNVQNSDRVARVSRIMAEINADVFILQEIEPQSMEPVAQALNGIGAGNYKTFYGATGGDQRVTFVYDQSMVRAATNPVNMFQDNEPVIQGTRKKVFPRLPIQMKLTAFATDRDASASTRPDGRIISPFDFELAGVHLKSQRRDEAGDDGTLQRQIAAEMLANWVKVDADDQDVIIAGDWNAAAERAEFKSIRALEDQGKLAFRSFNPDDEASYMFANGRSSRLDYIVLSASALDVAVDKQSKVLRWKQLADDIEDGRARDQLRWIIDEVSDHLPVIARFYFVDEKGD